MAKGGGSGSNHYEVQSRDATEPKLTDYGSNRATAAPRRRAAGRIEPQRKESGFIRIFPGFLRNSWREFVTLLRGTLQKREFFRPVSTEKHALARYPQPAVASQESLHLELIHDAEPLCGEPITLRF